MNAQLIKAKRGFFALYESTLADLEQMSPQALNELAKESAAIRNSHLYSERVAGELVFTACQVIGKVL